MSIHPNVAKAVALVGQPRERCSACGTVLGSASNASAVHTVNSAALACNVAASRVYAAIKRQRKATARP